MSSVTRDYVVNLSFLTGDSEKSVCDRGLPKGYVSEVKHSMAPYLVEIGRELSEMEIPEDVTRHCVLEYMVGYVYD